MPFRPHRRSLRPCLIVPQLLLSLFLISAPSPPRAWAFRIPAEPESQALTVEVHTFWNQDYLCLSAKVPDQMLTGSSAGPMSAPQQDDAIEFALALPSRTGPDAYRLIISAAGGMTLFSRDPQGRWRSDPSWITGPQTLKYAVALDGTLNQPNDVDRGFTVECAIPWPFLGGAATTERQIGFNVICWMQGENEGLASWAQTVSSEEDAADPRRWGKMLVTPSSALSVAQGASIQCPFLPRTPFVDGRLSAEEWLTASTLAFDKPEPVLQPGAIPPKQADVIGTLLAIYRYDWQGDPGRPGARFWPRGGEIAAIDQPREAPGPWYSFERVAWHRSQLAEIQRGGIDIILAHYRGDDDSRRTWSRAGLDRLAEALKEMRAEGRSYPLVGMMLDTAPLRGVDLKSAEGQRLIYGMIRDFFLHLPREFWAEVGARPQEGVGGGVPILLGEPDGLADWNGDFLASCQRSFENDFPRGKIAWLGSSKWRTRGAEGFYAYVRLPGAAGFSQEGTGGATAAAISPGAFPPPGVSSEIRLRREGRSYRSDWQRALAAAPEIVVLQSWNDFENGTDLAPSRQYGFAYVDLTRYFSARLGSRQAHPLRMKKQAVPEVLLPGVEYQAEFLIENVGTQDIVSGRRTTVDSRIVRRSDGKALQSRIGAQSIAIMAGQTLRLPVFIVTRDDKGDPLPPGEYLFSLVVMRSRVAYLRSKWFARPAAELTVPITVGRPPARRATLISTSLPSSIEAGASEHMVVRLRNDGAAAWQPGTTRLAYRWVRHTDDLAAPARDVVAEGGRVQLPKAVAPGEMVSVMVALSATRDDGSALPPAGPDDLWHYRVQWDVVEGNDTSFSAAGESVGEEAIQVVARDRGVAFQSAATPTEMPAGRRAAVPVEVGNAGPRPWAAGESYLTYRWHGWDGRELPTAAVRTALAADLGPGEKVKLEAAVEAPEAAGPYWLVWDMVANGEGFGATGGSRRADLLVAPVMVRGGGFRTLDLSKLTNVVAITDDSHRTRGDFDGQGRSFPSEWLPPDQSGAADRVYPSGYYSVEQDPAPVPFAYPDVSAGMGGAVACDGQTIPLGESGAKDIHLLVASTAERDSVTVRLELADGSAEEARVETPVWTEVGPDAWNVAAYTPYLRALTTDEIKRGHLFRRSFSAANGKAISLTLPVHPSMKIVAITVAE